MSRLHQLRQICTVFEQQVIHSPGAIALTQGHQTLTYQSLNERVNRLARFLRAQGLGRDCLVGIYLGRSFDLVVAILAVLKTGAAYLPLDFSYPQERIQYILENAEVSTVLTQAQWSAELGQLTTKHQDLTIITLDSIAPDLETFSCENLNCEIRPVDRAYVIYTSGSTGQPKGVQICHRGLINLLESMAQKPGLCAEDVVLALTTVAFDMSIPELFLPLIVGARMHLVDREVATDGYQLKTVLETHSITWMQGTPSTWRLLLASEWQGSPQLKILCGGETTTRELAEQLLERCESLWNMYGPTETTVWSMANRVTSGAGPVPLGHPLANTQIYLFPCPDQDSIQPDLEPVLPGEIGEIYIGGAGLAQGYLNREALTLEKFIPHPWSENPEDRLYKTGDLGYRDAEGNLYFTGRADTQVKIRGYRVELGEVETAILSHPLVYQAAVITRSDQSDSQQLLGYFVPQKKSYDSPWISFWDEAYRQPSKLKSNLTDPTLDFSGYRDSYTGELLPQEAIEEWTQHTVDRILALKPRRVLEIGCGKGLLLFRIAPHCSRYVGLDASEVAIAHLKAQFSQDASCWSHVEVDCVPAHQLAHLQSLMDEGFDTIVINSVIQYFPDLDYLLQVIETAIQLLQAGGRIFLGDIRNLALLEQFHETVYRRRQRLCQDDELGHSQSSVNSAELKRWIQQQVEQDLELVIHPAFFTQLKHHFPRIAQVVSQLKRGHHINELTQFRYDVVLHLDYRHQVALEPDWWDWSMEPLSLKMIQDYLLKHQPYRWGLRRVLNPRVQSENHSKIDSLDVCPEKIWSLAHDLPYRVHLRWSQEGRPDEYDVIFQRIRIEQEKDDWAHPSLAETWSMPDCLADCIHQPVQSKAETKVSAQAGSLLQERSFSLSQSVSSLATQLREFLRDSLPGYMVPSQLIELQHMPMTPNGKVDRKALSQIATRCEFLPDDFVAPQTEIEHQLAMLWQELLEMNDVGQNTHFFESGGHSLLAAQLMMRIRETFEVEVPLMSLFQHPTLTALAHIIEQHQQGKEAIAITPLIDWNADATLDPEIVPNLWMQDLAERKTTLQPSAIFLTGATGFVGAFLLDELLRQTPAKLYCLVRACHPTEAQRRLENYLEACQIDWELYRDRIYTICGDLAQPQLGLTPDQFDELAQTVDVIYHCGASVNLFYPYAELRLANVKGTQEILRLASQAKLKPVHYLSTLDVLQALRPEVSESSNPQVWLEDRRLPEFEHLSNGYAQSKWVAERLVMAAQDRGIPCTIYRLGMTTGHSKSGFSNPKDMISQLIYSFVTLKTVPYEDFSLNLAPVDWVCRTIATLAQDPQYWGRIFHVINPQSIGLMDLVRPIKRRGYDMRLTSYPDWLQTLKLSSSSQSLAALLPELERHSHQQKPAFFQVLGGERVSTQELSKALKSAGLENISLSVGIMEQYLTYLEKRGYIPGQILEERKRTPLRQF